MTVKRNIVKLVTMELSYEQICQEKKLKRNIVNKKVQIHDLTTDISPSPERVSVTTRKRRMDNNACIDRTKHKQRILNDDDDEMKTTDDKDNIDDDDSIDDDESVNSTFTIVQKRSRKDYHCLCSNEFINGNFDKKTSLRCIGKYKKY